MDELGQDGLSDEVRIVRLWRYREAREAGLTLAEARLYADSEIDAERLRHLVELHCPPEQLARILL